ncbi:sulfotransferase [Thiocapsa bogorovii]|uniref:sulfotransferase n=1 Tax=Thiocapsa bogorovii TaxID=521689 RepID=UPI001E3F3FBE|nr:sulfotransferase [Thiocapsa bogorovii]UHD17125.1 sulfotransferase [Thiocapsa bogorovii]
MTPTVRGPGHPQEPGKNKCVIVLSTKSSGSSAIQRLIGSLAGARHVRHTRHRESETLYWTKAASVLGLPQIKMLDSEVPIPARRARRELVSFLRKNTRDFRIPTDPRDMIFLGWEKLCESHRPVFLEKSPHHLVQWSALELMLECEARLDSTEFLYIGLIRNPMDVLYSAWSRWRTFPEEAQFEWELAYRNLQCLRERLDDRLVVVRYEDMVSDLDTLDPVIRFVGATRDQVPADYLHARSFSKWKDDRDYGFQLAPSVREMAHAFGYTSAELDNPENPRWRIFRTRTRRSYRTRHTMLAPIRMLRRAHSVLTKNGVSV